MTNLALTPDQTSIAGPVALVVMDGIGLGQGDDGDAVAAAKTPNLDLMAAKHLTLALAAHGTAVGMPGDGDMGNSEVGHNALGAGRIFDQGAKRVAEALASGEIFEGPVWGKLLSFLSRSRGTLHLLGLLSDGNVHSHIEHIEILLKRADAEGINRIRLHVLLDGRDVPRTSALEYIRRIEACLNMLRTKGRDYAIASGGGRQVITMDRYEAQWSMVERGWHTHVLGKGRAFGSATEAVEILRAETKGIGDQDLDPFVIADAKGALGPINDGDAVVAFNFRGDRMLEICRAFESEEFKAFDRGRRPEVFFAGITLYDGDSHTPKNYLVAPPDIDRPLGELLCHEGVKQIACSETQKFGHVTYFFNGNRSGQFKPELERYIEVPSFDPPFDDRPQMKAQEITDAVVSALKQDQARFVRLNYANGDMVGHTGNFEATVAAVEAVDRQVGRLWEVICAMGGALIVTADHGNAEEMGERDKKGQLQRDGEGRLIPKTSHSLNPVPCHIALSPADQHRYHLSGVPHPGLGNIASTVAQLLGFSAPDDFLPSLLTATNPK